MAIDFTVEEWSREGSLTETVAKSTNGIVARAAFKALVGLRAEVASAAASRIKSGGAARAGRVGWVT
jgi:hypothetical protein